MKCALMMITWLSAAPLLAQPAPALNVARGEGTSDCPDAAGLIARIEEIRKSPARADQPPYQVTFARDEQGVYAEIASVQTGAERVLTDVSPDCAALAKATAVTLALLFDADAHALEEQPAPSPPPVEQPTPAPAAPQPHEPSEHRLQMHYALGAPIGVIAPIALAGAFELGYAYRSVRAALGGMYTLPTSYEVGSGHVKQWFTGGWLLGCYAPWRHGLWRFDLCAGVLAAEVQAAARGFAEDRTSIRGWFAPLVEARFGLLPDHFGFELTAALLAPTTRRDFAVDGAGIAYESSPIAALITLRAGYGIAASELRGRTEKPK